MLPAASYGLLYSFNTYFQDSTVIRGDDPERGVVLESRWIRRLTKALCRLEEPRNHQG